MKKMDYLGLIVEFQPHELYVKRKKELSKDFNEEVQDKWIYRVDGGDWKDGGKTLYDFTGFLYSHKTKEDLLKSYKQ